MDNILLTKVSKYGLNLVSEEIKNSVNSFLVIGSVNHEDQNLISRLESNDLNNNLSYQEILDNRWNGFEDRIFTSYYDKNNFLTFELKLPYEETFSIYVYAFALLNVSNGKKEIISITRSPSIFNKVKNSSSTFYIKFTFSQENKNVIYNSDLFSSQFISRELLFIANLDSSKNVINSDLDLSFVNIGTKLYSKNLQDNTVVIGNSITDSSLQSNELRISQNPKATISGETIFLEKTMFNQNDYVTKPEFDKAINDHNHNKEYYRIGEAVNDSFMLDGKSAEYYANYNDIEWLKVQLNKKVDNFGGTINGYLRLIRPKDVQYLEDEVPPLYYVESLIKNLKDYTTGEFQNIIQSKIDSNKNSIKLLENKETQDILSVRNEMSSNKNEQNTINQNVQNILNTKMDKSNHTFTSTPVIQQTQNLSNLTDTSVLNYGGVKKAIENVNRTIDIDLSSLQNTRCYPVIFNEGNPNGFTDSIIWNVKSNYVRCMSKIHIYGNGADNGNNSAFLVVNHSKTGPESLIKKVYSPSSSTAIIVYLRGGFKYKCNLRGTDSDPKIVASSYTLQGSSYTATYENWDNNQVIPIGSWWFTEFQNLTEINLDYRTKPDIPINGKSPDTSDSLLPKNNTWSGNNIFRGSVEVYGDIFKKVGSSGRVNDIEFFDGSTRTAYIGHAGPNNRDIWVKSFSSNSKIQLENYTVIGGTLQLNSNLIARNNANFSPAGNYNRNLYFTNSSIGSNCKFDLDLENKVNINNVPTPTQNHQVANKAYVDSTSAPYIKLSLNARPTTNDIPNGKLALVVR